jgi:L-asparaginase/Glu-tRNA(Gln) amidotransferase subunit D
MHLVAKNAESFFTVGFASARFLFFQAKQVQAATLLIVSTGGTVSLIQSSQRGRDQKCNADIQKDPNFHEK